MAQKIHCHYTADLFVVITAIYSQKFLARINKIKSIQIFDKRAIMRRLVTYAHVLKYYMSDI